ncbi:MAG: elongation factor Ts [Deltaproteobacteria bacterium]
MEIPVSSIKELRNLTSASVADCKKALTDAKCDLKKAQELLRKRGLEAVAKKGERVAKEGRIEAYIHHGNKIGVLLEVDCETDFVARDAGFSTFTKDVSMQIAATSPLYIKKEDVPEEVLKNESDKETFFKNHVLLEQVFIKDPGLTINDLLGSLVAKFNERIVIRRFIRYKLGE